MAIYHLSVKTISRSAGRSATAAAAYRTASRIVDERSGEIHDYTRRGGVESTELVLPDNAPDWAADRASLWNAAEQAETRKNSTVAREFEIALPAELSASVRQALAHDFARELVERHGCAADVAIHAPGQAGDHRNHHAHILCSTRRLGSEGFTEKTRELDDRKTGEVDYWRGRFAELQNERLQALGIQAQVDHRSLEAQAITDREPSHHQGPAITGLLRRGEPSAVASRRAEEAHARLFAARELGRLERELADADRQIIDTTTDLATAIREREDRRREAARPAGRASPGPAVNSARFRVKPTAERAVQEVKPARPDFKTLPIEQQAQAFNRLRDGLTRERKARLDQVAQKASDRQDRRTRTARQLWEAKPQPPTGLLAGFKQAAYDIALGHWKQNLRRAERLQTQAEKTRNKIVYATLYQRIHETWAQRVLERTEPELTRRVEAHRAMNREQERQAQERGQLEREFKDLAVMRAMKAYGYRDTSDDWQATPKPLRELIDDYNRRPKEQQARALAALLHDPEQSKAIAALIEQRREKTRDQDRSR